MESFITTHLGTYNREAKWLFEILLHHLMWYQFIVLIFLF